MIPGHKDISVPLGISWWFQVLMVIPRYEHMEEVVCCREDLLILSNCLILSYV